MIGLFIGSFNPPTLAHLEIVLKLSKEFERIVLVPVNSKDKYLININHRIKMLEIYRNKYNFLVIDDIMKNYSYLNYRIIDLLKNKYGDVKIIIGSDLLDKISSFDNYSYLLSHYSYVVIERDECDAKNIIKSKYNLWKDKFKVIKFNNTSSSTKVRELLKNNKNIENILDLDVFEYIKKHHLY